MNINLESMDGCRQGAIALEAVDAHAYHEQALAKARDKTKLTEAVYHHQQAVTAAPDNPFYRAYWGRDLVQIGRVEEGVKQLQLAASQRAHDPDFQTSYLWYLNYLEDQGAEVISDHYRCWGERFTPAHLAQHHHQRNRDPQRRLRIGYISPDLCRHSVAYYLEPILDGHDRDQFEIFGYGHLATPDGMTERLAHKCDRYASVWGLNWKQMAIRLEQDQLDILVAVAGQCANNCLRALAYKPAPIQVDLGGITTTGMSQIDYRFTDTMVDPPQDQQYYTETLAYLPGGGSVFCPPVESPWITSLPALTNGYFTFGSFNNNAKIGPEVVKRWAQILQVCPNSRFLLKSLALGDTGVCSYYQDLFAAYGIAPERLMFYGERSYAQHLEILGQVDLALDAFPFNGAMTTMEGFWMGVPIVTLAGQTCVGRTGKHLLHRLNLDIFTAHTSEEYVAKAVAFAAQPKSLAQIRAGLRDTFLKSPLCQPQRMAGEMEAAYRDMWHQWLAQTEVSDV